MLLLFFGGWFLLSCLITPGVNSIKNQTVGFLVYAMLLLIMLPYELLRIILK